MLLDQRGRTLRLGRFGAVSDPPPPGASQVLDTGVIQRAVDSGVDRIVMGDSRPCLADGVLRYKAKFGATIVPTRFPQPVLAIFVRRWNSAIATCLREQPLVAMRGGKPYACRVEGPPAQYRIRLEPLGEANA
jgi:hypothetical protein